MNANQHRQAGKDGPRSTADTVARAAGEEFLALATGMDDQDGGSRLALFRTMPEGGQRRAFCEQRRVRTEAPSTGKRR
jgi:hypothetical protein